MKTAKRRDGKRSISTHEMRFQFGRVLEAVKAGRSLTLTYRNKPLARIIPINGKNHVPKDDPIFSLHKIAEPIGPLSNADIDAAIYGR